MIAWQIMHSIGKRKEKDMKPLRFDSGQKVLFPSQGAAKKTAELYSKNFPNFYYRVIPKEIFGGLKLGA